MSSALGRTISPKLFRVIKSTAEAVWFWSNKSAPHVSCVWSLRRGHANLLCIVPILVYVFRRIHIFGCFSNLYTTIFSPPNCFFPPHEHFFSISIPFHCKTVPSRPPMQDIVTWNLLSKKNVAPFIILSYSNLAVDGRQQYVNEPKIIIKNYSLDYPWWDSNPQSLN